MQLILTTFACRAIGAIALVAGLTATSSAVASDLMPAAQQNALVAKYCVVCHNDAHVNGGLSLEHFDAAQPDPSLVAMTISKVGMGARHPRPA